MDHSATPAPALELPPAVAPIRIRQPQHNIPQTKADREYVLLTIREYLKTHPLVPPIPMGDLRFHAEEVARMGKIDPLYVDFVGVVMNNELWRDTLASVPFERRLLLLPKCLRLESKCPAPFDEFGLLCKKCGLCSIQDLQVEAEKMGYAVLVAEGSPIVMALIDTGQIDAIIGVSCLSVLERAFPHMEAAAVPGIAIPLLQDDCVDTSVDMEWIWEVIHLTSDDRTRRLELTSLRETVDTWFTRDSLADIMGTANSETEEIAHDWLARAGKRWRPFLSVAVHQALQADPCAAIPEDLKKIAVAVECFHKASLIHDDIEDADEKRYGEETMHAAHGIPVALNVGDFLLGEGYRLIAESAASAQAKARMIQVAARGHSTLSLGQGAELCWARAPKPMTSIHVLDIFRQKTAPAFEVALRLGAIYAGGEDEISEVINTYSESLGIAYQIRDDLNDLVEGAESDDVKALRPTLPLAVALERASGEDKKALEAAWRREGDITPERLREIMIALGVEGRARELYEAYKEQAVQSLWDLENPNLKGLLRRVIGKIFNQTEIKGWCHEFEARNAPGGAPSAKSVA